MEESKLAFTSKAESGYMSQHSFASSGEPSGMRVKLLISYNGKVMPRPSDRKLRYVGGDTRIISVHRYITYADFMLKIMEVYGQFLLLKYQLPDEELDALISVSSDEDLENMMDEYERLDVHDGAPRMRLFLFSDGDDDALHLNDTTDPRLSERRYMEAVNCVQGTSLQTFLEPTLLGAPKDLLGLNFSEALDPSQFSGTVSAAMHSSGFIPEVIVSVVQSAPTVHSFPPKQVAVNTSSAYPDVTSPPQLLFGTNQHTHSNFHMNGALLAGGVYHQAEYPTNGITSLHGQQDHSNYSFTLQDGLSLQGSNTPIHESIVPTLDSHNLLQNVGNHGKLSVIEPQEKMIKMKERIEHPSQADNRRTESYSDSSAPVASQQWLIPETSWQQHLDSVSDTGQGSDIWEDTHLHTGHVQQDFVQQNLNVRSSIYQQLEHPHEQQAMLGGGYTLTSLDPTSETGTLPSLSSQIELGGTYKKQNAGQHSSGESKRTSNHGVLAGHHSRSEPTTMATGYNEQVICKEQPIPAQFLDHQHSPQEQLSVPSFASGSLGPTLPLYTDFVPYKGRVAGLHNRQGVIGQFHLDGQKSLSDPHVSSSGEFHEQQFAAHPCYQNGENEVEWVFEERSNEFVESRAHREKHIVVGQKLSDENRCVTEDSIVTSSAEKRSTSLLGINPGGDLLQPKLDFGAFDLERNSLAVDRAVFSDTLQAGYSVADSALDFPTESLVFDSDIDPSFKRLPFNSNRGTSIFASPSVRNISERQRGYVADRFEPAVQISAEPGLESSIAKNMPLTGFENSVAGFDGSSLFAVPITSSMTSAESVANLGSGYTLPSTTTVDLHFKQSKKVEDTATVFGRPGSSNGFLVSTLDGSKLLPVFDSVSSLDELGYDGCTQVDSRGYGERKNTIEHGSENVAAVGYQPTLYSTPTFSIENWMKELRQSGSDEQAARGSQHDEQIAESQLEAEAEAESEMVFDDFNNLGIIEDEKAEHKVEEPRNAATIAEEEAVLRGLQIIKYVDLEELRELGSGTFGTVYHGKWRGTDVAIKRIKSSCFAGRPPDRERLIADFWQEACILGQLHHPNVVAFYGIVPDGPGGTLATVTEYMVNGSMKQVLQKKDRSIDRRKRLLIAMDAAFGMEYLHGKKIVHFDLKCENLLVNMRDSQRPICKVADLGLSKVKHQTMVSGGVRGTLPWMAPELLNGSSSLVSEKVDVFSFGVVLWELLTGEEPYANMHYGAIIGGIVNNTLRPQIPNWCDTPWRLLMERCWSAEPKERPGFAEIVAELRAMAASFNARAQGQVLSYGRKGLD